MRTLTTLSLALLLAACGGDDGGGASEPGDGAAPASLEAWADDVELTDEMMEDFFAVAEDMKTVGNNPAKGLSVLEEHGWTMERWTWVAGQLAIAVQAEAVTDSRAEIESGFEKMEGEMERLRQRAAAATGEEREQFEPHLEQFEKIYGTQKKTLAPMFEGAAKSAERNRAILDKYRGRWESLGR